MIKVTNISNCVVGLVTQDSEGFHQTDLGVWETIEVPEVTPQIYQLADPYLSVLRLDITEDEESTEDTEDDVEPETDTDNED